ncbi:unnamed protein product, partial [Meganyctiphanes norvegica]
KRKAKLNRQGSVLSSCWKPEDDEHIPQMRNVYASLATSRADREFFGSREVFGVRDMTRNHISSTEQLQTSIPNLTVVPITTDTGARQRASVEIREIKEMETVL